MMYEFGEPKWFTDERGNKIPIYDGLDFDTCMLVREHHRRIQSMVDTYKRKYPVGINSLIIDNYIYKFSINKNDRKIKLISRMIYGGDIDV